ncbi:MAG: thioredoxin family protein [Opitutaceae bacterium]|jgi:thiol-disulfide isomerase/thioredoxin|nr:thioredoxin family protein [Opitutaceae bacterium]
MKKAILALLAPAIAALAPLLHAAGKDGAPAIISRGERITIEDHIVPEKITIFYFTSNYHPPCNRLAALLDKLHAQRDDIAVVKVDINRPHTRGIDWGSPVAQQYHLKSVPYFQIYNNAGKFSADGKAARAKINEWLNVIGD